MTKAIRRMYRRVRKAGVACIVGESARVSLQIARTIEQFKSLEAGEYVQLVARPDEFPDVDDEEREQAERDGVWVVLSQYRTDPQGRWVTADSIGHCIGYADPSDPLDNCYVPDLMQSAIDQLREALKGRFCSHCGHRAA